MTARFSERAVSVLAADPYNQTSSASRSSSTTAVFAGRTRTTEDQTRSNVPRDWPSMLRPSMRISRVAPARQGAWTSGGSARRPAWLEGILTRELAARMAELARFRSLIPWGRAEVMAAAGRLQEVDGVRRRIAGVVRVVSDLTYEVDDQRIGKSYPLG